MLKLEYCSYNANIKYECVCNNTKSSDVFYYTNGSREGFVQFCVIEALGEIMMDEEIRGEKSLNLGESPVSSNDHR